MKAANSCQMGRLYFC